MELSSPKLLDKSKKYFCKDLSHLSCECLYDEHIFLFKKCHFFFFQGPKSSERPLGIVYFDSNMYIVLGAILKGCFVSIYEHVRDFVYWVDFL